MSISTLAKGLSSYLLPFWNSKKLIGTITTHGMSIKVFSDSVNIGVYHYRYDDKSVWIPTIVLLEHLASGTNVPFNNFISDMNEKGETMSELTIHSLTWAGGPRQKSWRFMTATVTASSCGFPFLYLFRGNCVAILVVLHSKGRKYGLTVATKKGSGWQNETFAGMTADQADGGDADPEILAACAELKEEFGVIFSGIKVRRVGPPAGTSVGGCDEFCSPYVADMEVDMSFIDCLGIISSEYEDEKFQFRVEELKNMVLDDSKKALCSAGYLKHPPCEVDICRNSKGGPLTSVDLTKALMNRRSDLQESGGALKDIDNITVQIQKIMASFPAR
jgi:hypothetical protein